MPFEMYPHSVVITLLILCYIFAFFTLLFLFLYMKTKSELSELKNHFIIASNTFL